MQTVESFTVVGHLFATLLRAPSDWDIDITSGNILVKEERHDAFEQLEQIESQSPSLPVQGREAAVYKSRVWVGILSGRCVLTDFGHARDQDPANSDGGRQVHRKLLKYSSAHPGTTRQTYGLWESQYAFPSVVQGRWRADSTE